MTWSQQFIDTLGIGSVSVTYVLRFLNSSLGYTAQPQTIQSHGELNLRADQVVIDNARITPGRWATTFGGFSVQINGDLRPIKSGKWRRGQIAELIMVRNGKSTRVSIGQIRSISGGRGVWTVSFSDLISAMVNRLNNGAPAQLDFCYNTGKVVKVTTTFNFSSDTKLYLTNIDHFEREAGKDGMVFVNNIQHGHTAYYLWDTKAYTIGSEPQGYLNITSTGVYPGLSAHNHLDVNDEVTSFARLKDRIDYIFCKLLMSTGAGTQGFFDTYPLSWSLGYKFSPRLIWKSDMDDFYNRIWKPSSAAHECQLATGSPTSIRSILQSAANMGLWPVIKQGKITFRGADDPNTTHITRVAMRLYPNDIFDDAIKHEIYSPNQPVYYTRSRIDYYESSGQTNENVLSSRSTKYFPAANQISRDNSLIYSATNQLEKATADLDRIKNWDHKPYEEIVINVSERAAVLVAGDIIEITHPLLYGLNEGRTKSFENRRAMVLGNRWLPSRARCILTLGVLARV